MNYEVGGGIFGVFGNGGEDGEELVGFVEFFQAVADFGDELGLRACTVGLAIVRSYRCA